MAIYGIILAIVFSQKVASIANASSFTVSDYFTGAPRCPGARPRAWRRTLKTPRSGWIIRAAWVARGEWHIYQGTACSGPA